MNEDEFLLDEQDILERVDEYTLYCHYLQFAPDIGMKYNSPIRPDDVDPSFGIFNASKMPHREYGWKDQGCGKHGDVFKLVQLILEQRHGSCSKHQALAQIKSDFALGPTIDARPIKLVEYVPKPRDPMEIRVKSRAFDATDLKFWKQFNIGQAQLDRYLVKPISYYWTYPSQAVPKFPRGLGYWYIIHPKSKLYFPHEKKEFKFRNDLTERELEGFAQLRYESDLLVITKSYKDVMCLDSFGYESVAPRGEWTMIPDDFLRYFETRYKRILILFDNDGKHHADKYPYPQRFIPKSSGQKDTSDFCKHYGPTATAELLKQLL